MAENHAPTTKQRVQSLLLDWLIWAYMLCGGVYFFRDQLSGSALALPLYLGGVGLGLIIAVVLARLGGTLGQRIVGISPRPTGKKRVPWYRTQAGFTATLLGVLTFVLGWQITEINLYYVFTRAENMTNMTERLVRPYWPVLGMLIGQMIETIFLALMSTFISIPLGVLVSFFAARNLMYGLTTKWGRLQAEVLLALTGAILGRRLVLLIAGALPSDILDVALIQGILSLILVPAGLILGGYAGNRLMKRMAHQDSRAVCALVAAMGLCLGVGAAYMLASAASAVIFGASWAIFVRDVPVWPYVILALGGAAGAFYSCHKKPDSEFPIGRLVYAIVRFILNATRSIEPFVWALIFVTWFRIGPFPGMVALMVHSVAALAKLYSEQIESIDPGPLEAVRASGANELQTVAYAVVPQIIPPFISFTIYRWDINVRMSTIIGLVGGGGIGQMLFQYQNLGQWRTVSVCIILIVVVVMTLDWVSARIREKIL